MVLYNDRGGKYVSISVICMYVTVDSFALYRLSWVVENRDAGQILLVAT